MATISYKQFVIIIFLLMGLIFGINQMYTVMHEQAHVQIFAYYGIDSKVEYYPNGLFHNPAAHTIPLTNKTCPDNCQNLHALNEIIGYQLGVALFGILAMIAAIGIILLGLKVKQDDSIK